ncbi:mismatch repair endonuclease PMS2 [Bradysia coprophila]|uniref:mismatch repair endonuclease PMS2 n=1 Tax=Bradysia coprophila TaxID=38358 RepID=UPI00187D773A|nr:mismatch repair endonuclease PMS2 [Bradysia coprophila]
MDNLEATSEAAKAIRPIHSSTVHKICSGQVVLNLATAVKELVENALDAHATIIEVKLRDQGIESIEVSDNGDGVEESNFEGLTAKYHTSKLREFTDLECVETFGFRGEALSSLCALSKMVITTRHRGADFGTRLELDDRGTIIKKEICARQNGTSVQLTNLFGSLPVRKKEFTRNIKKEFAKMCQILQGYCLVATGVRIMCTNQTVKGTKSLIMATNGGHSVMDNISAIFGTKQVFDVLQITPPAELDETQTKALLEELDPNSSSENVDSLSEIDLKRFTIDGWISTCHHGSGRSSKDRQFIYINSRPCEPKKISKIVNEIYSRYNSNQNPFVFLNIIVQRSDVDVNITPDKRQLLLNNENVLLLVLKACLSKTFENVPSVFKMQNLNLSASSAANKSKIDTAPNAKKFSQMLSQWKKTGHTDNPIKSEKIVKRKVCDEVESRNLKMRKIQEYLSQKHDETIPMSDDETLSSSIDQSMIDRSRTTEIDSSYLNTPESTSTPERQHDLKVEQTSPFKIIDSYKGVTGPSRVKSESILSRIMKTEAAGTTRKINSPIKAETKAKPNKTPTKDVESIIGKLANRPEWDSEDNQSDTSSRSDDDLDEDNEENGEGSDEEDDEHNDEENEEVNDDENEEGSEKYDSENDSLVDADQIGFKTQCTRDMSDVVSTSIDEISELMAAELEIIERLENKSLMDRLKFKATIEPAKNKLAEEELQTEITKKSFSQMEIIGQFNLGFIVVKLNDDLFIVDQHATDEKFNYETLQKETTLYNQKLVVPQHLELTAVSEMILIDNLEVFEKNGFKFQIDHDALPTKKIQLTAKPMSKGWQFGKDEIDELIFLLQESPNSVLRPSKISAMFASRACRKSVMIGTPLSGSDMQRLISQMGEIEHPWNCPHGRPTMRHLVNLTMVNDSSAEDS